MVGKPQDRKFMCNVTLRSVHATTVAVEKQEVLHILRVCSTQCPWTILSSVACWAL